MTRLNRTIPKLISLLIGLPLLVVGIILIPLPGPGLLITLLAFYILSREFGWASKKFEYAKIQLSKIINDAKKRAENVNKD